MKATLLRVTFQSKNSGLQIWLKYKHRDVRVTTVWLMCFGVPRCNFQRVIGRLTPACWVDVGVIRVHPLIVDMTPAIIMDLKEEERWRWRCEAREPDAVISMISPVQCSSSTFVSWLIISGYMSVKVTEWCKKKRLFIITTVFMSAERYILSRRNKT